MIKKCEICGTSFESYRNVKKFCSEECVSKKKKIASKEYNAKKYKNGPRNTKYFNKEFRDIVANALKNNETYESISKRLNVSGSFIASIATEYGLIKFGKDHEKTLSKFDIVKITSKISKSNRIEYIYHINCTECYKENEVVISHLKRLETRDDDYICTSCEQSFKNKTKRMSSLKKRSTNTTGYIGVHVKQSLGKIYGYEATLVYKGKNLMRNKYKDPDLNKKTLIQAAVDRDLFIIDRGIPHTRNFSNKELIGKMEYLAHEQLKELKEKVKDGRINLDNIIDTH